MEKVRKARKPFFALSLSQLSLKGSMGKTLEEFRHRQWVYTYYDRLATGLRQLMAGERKFALNFIARNDLVALTREAADVSGIPYVMESDMEEAEKILA